VHGGLTPMLAAVLQRPAVAGKLHCWSDQDLRQRAPSRTSPNHCWDRPAKTAVSGNARAVDVEHYCAITTKL
jgi:hypothetical protein